MATNWPEKMTAPSPPRRVFLALLCLSTAAAAAYVRRPAVRSAAAAPRRPRPFPSAFAAAPGWLRPRRGATAAGRHARSTRRRVVRSLSQIPLEEDEEDGTFFLDASRRAAQRRMQQLRDGDVPLAVALSSSPSSSDTVGSSEGKPVEAWSEETTAEDTAEIEASAGGSVDEEEGPPPSSPAPRDEKVPIDPFRDRRQKAGPIAKVRDDYDFQKRLLEARLSMQGPSNLAREEGESSGGIVGEGGTTDVAAGGSVAVEKIAPKDDTQESSASESASNDDLAGTSTEAPNGGVAVRDTLSGAGGSPPEPASAKGPPVTDKGGGASSDEDAEETARWIAEQNDAAKERLAKRLEEERAQGPPDPEAARWQVAAFEPNGEENEEVQSELGEEAWLEDQNRLVEERLEQRLAEEQAQKEEGEPEVEGGTATTLESGKPRLSSDGRELFEPSPESLRMKQENVDLGLLVLTRSLLALQSVLDKEE